MGPDLTSPTPETTVTATPATEPAQTPGTVQPGGQMGGAQSAPAEDGFTKLDVNTLPPQLKQAYDSMLRDYKSKTTELAQERKKYEGYDAFKQKSDLYDQFAAQEEFVKSWNTHVQEVNARQKGGQGAGMDDPIQARFAQLEKQLEAEHLARKETEILTFLDAFSTAKNEKQELVNPDFDSLNEFKLGTSKQNGEYSLLRACIELADGGTPQEKVSNGYKAAKTIRDQLLEEGRKQGMGRMLSKVRNSTEAPTITSDKTTFNGDAKKLSVREARELAEKGVVVR